MVKKISLILLVCVLSFFLFYLFGYKTSSNALIEADLLYITPKVSGELVEFNVENNSEVEKGEIIAKINSKPYELELQKAQEKLKKAQNELKTSIDEIDKMTKLTQKTEKDIENSKQQLENANNDYVLYKNAYKDGSVTDEDIKKASKNLEKAEKDFLKAQDELKETKNNLQLTISKQTSTSAEIKLLMAEVEEAKLNLSYTTIVSPIDGVIVNQKVYISNFVDTSKPILAIKPLENYITAEFKGVKLKKGRNVLIKVKGCKKIFKGTVVEIINQDDETTKVKIIFRENTKKYNFPINSEITVKVRV